MAAPKGNTNAEKYDLETAIAIFKDSIDMTNQKELVKVQGVKLEAYKYDFIGEIAGELNTFKDIFTHLLGRFKTELQELNSQLYTNIERNCYWNGKKGAIKEASAIMNLKSNHRWTDRRDQTSSDGTMTPKSTIVTTLTQEQLQQALNK
jgi:hypothetical protein